MKLLSARTVLLSKGEGIVHPKSVKLRVNYCSDTRVWFRPRVLRDVANVDWSTTILGQKSSMPVYIVSYWSIYFCGIEASILIPRIGVNSPLPLLGNLDTPMVN